MEVGGKRQRGDTARLRLVEAGERLFALHGISGTALRQINDEAGQRNMSAAHYHFGSREGVIAAIFALRTPAIEACRRAILDRYKNTNETLDIHMLASIIIKPWFEHIKNNIENSYWLRFIESMGRDLENTLLFVEEKNRCSFEYARSSLADCLAYLPKPLATLRVRMAVELAISAAASIEASIVDGEQDPQSLELLMEVLIDGMSGFLTAPVSRRTLDQLKKSHSPEIFTAWKGIAAEHSPTSDLPPSDAP